MLRKYRRAYGYAQNKFAEKVHISPTYLCDLEHGNKKPSAGLAKVIADVFGVKVSAVFPDGVAVKDCRKKFVQPQPYMPDDKPRVPPRQYPRRDFAVMCWHCRSTMTMRADDYHPVTGDDLRCPACGARFGDILPLEEAAHV
jgi:DNA-binding XRE family transcriptional regulator